MKLTESQKTVVQRQFDCFCKKVLREEARDYIRSLKRRSEKEAVFSDLSNAQLSRLAQLDDYPSASTSFFVQEQTVFIRDDRLAEAISKLAPDRQEIILLSYFLNMSDQEIAKRLTMARSTVQYKRANALKDIKKKLEG